MLEVYKGFEIEIDERNSCDFCNREMVIKSRKKVPTPIININNKLNKTIAILDNDYVDSSISICIDCLEAFIVKINDYHNDLE